jgi:hypothetical protein
VGWAEIATLCLEYILIGVPQITSAYGVIRSRTYRNSIYGLRTRSECKAKSSGMFYRDKSVGRNVEASLHLFSNSDTNPSQSNIFGNSPMSYDMVEEVLLSIDVK